MGRCPDDRVWYSTYAEPFDNKVPYISWGKRIMALVWSDEYATGEPTIDLQHQQLFESVNELGDLVAAGTFNGPDVDRLTKFLATYVTSHFSFEEVCMNKYKCPIADQNKAAHEGFLTLYTEFLENYKASGGSLEDLKSLHNTAEDWLVSHIMKVDTHLRACVNS